MRRLVAIAVIVLASASPAAADAIDGEWCSGKGASLKIDGPTIRIPSGTTIQGQYDRHAFAYEAPAGDPDQGVTVMMDLISDDLMKLYRMKDGNPGDAEEWRRCNVTS